MKSKLQNSVPEPLAVADRSPLLTATGPRAVPGSQRPQTRGGVPAFSTPPMQSNALRAGDGSRSAPCSAPGAREGLPGCAQQSAASDFGGRLVTLCDGRFGLRSGLQVEVSESPNHESRITDRDSVQPSPVLDFIASDETLDRCDEIIAAGGWRLDSYRRNPVFQNA